MAFFGRPNSKIKNSLAILNGVRDFFFTVSMVSAYVFGSSKKNFDARIGTAYLPLVGATSYESDAKLN